MAKQNTQKKNQSLKNNEFSQSSNNNIDNVKTEDKTSKQLDVIIELLKELINKVDKDKRITSDILFPPNKR